MNLITYLEKRGIEFTEHNGLSVGGYLDLRGTGITQLPQGLSVGGYLDLRGTGITQLPDELSIKGSLYLDAEKVENVAYRKNCGTHNRTIFAAWIDETVKISAGCFLGTIYEFEAAVDGKYHGGTGEAYKKAAYGCAEELVKKLESAA